MEIWGEPYLSHYEPPFVKPWNRIRENLSVFGSKVITLLSWILRRPLLNPCPNCSSLHSFTNNSNPTVPSQLDTPYRSILFQIVISHFHTGEHGIQVPPWVRAWLSPWGQLALGKNWKEKIHKEKEDTMKRRGCLKTNVTHVIIAWDRPSTPPQHLTEGRPTE